MKSNKIFQTAFAAAFLALAPVVVHAQGLEDIIVETYYVSDANDATDTDGGALPAGSVTYRIYVDMAPGYELQAVFGNTEHELRIATSTLFFNNEDRGEIKGGDIGQQYLGDNTVALDSYITMGGASTAHLAVLKSEDLNGSIVGGVNSDGGSSSIPGGLLVNNAALAGIPLTTADGLIPGVPAAVQILGLSLSALADVNAGPVISSFGGAWSVLEGVQGPTATNRVLVAQITTNGELSFELNVQLGAPDGSTEQYVASNPQAGQTLFSALNYPLVTEPANGSYSNAAPVLTGLNCTPIPGDLTTALASIEASSAALTGEDQWYTFTATEPGITIEVLTAAFDALVELQDGNGNLIETENVVAGIGNEILNFGALVPGQTYYIAVRNYDSSLGTGTYTICVKRLRDSGCNYGPGPYSACSVFKAVNVGASSYTFNFTSTNTLQSFTGTVGGGITVLQLGLLPPGADYTVSIDANYSLVNGAGVPETITVEDLETCTLTMLPQVDLDLRSTDQCPAIKYPYSIIGAQTWLCGASYYEWRFYLPGQYLSPVAQVDGPAGSRYLNLSSVMLPASANGQYEVQIRPWFSNGAIAGSWGTDYQCLQLPVPAPMVLAGEEEMADLSVRTAVLQERPTLNLYPNPNTGDQFVLNIEGMEGEEILVRVTNQLGQVVYTTTVVNTAAQPLVITPAADLATGLYMVEVTDGLQSATQRMVIQR